MSALAQTLECIIRRDVIFHMKKLRPSFFRVWLVNGAANQFLNTALLLPWPAYSWKLNHTDVQNLQTII